MTMTDDRTIRIQDALVRLGPVSDRIYLMKPGRSDPSKLAEALTELADREGLGKVFAKVPRRMEDAFLRQDYRREALIPDFYRGEADAVFLARYQDADRPVPADPESLSLTLQIAQGKSGQCEEAPALPAGFCFRYGRPDDAEELSALYRTVFQTYPFPVHDPEYLQQTMRENTLYFTIRQKGKIVAASSAEMDHESSNAEMTDFATLPEWRGKGFAKYLLQKMERDISRLGIRLAYTIARASSTGINCTFARLGYTYAGRLINNTNIAGCIESMNVWYHTCISNKQAGVTSIL